MNLGVEFFSITSMSEIKNNHKIDEILRNTNFDELGIMYLPMNEQHNVSEVLGVVSAPADDATGTMGMAPGDVRCGNMGVGLDLCHFVMPHRLFETLHLLH